MECLSCNYTCSCPVCYPDDEPTAALEEAARNVRDWVDMTPERALELLAIVREVAEMKAERHPEYDTGWCRFCDSHCYADHLPTCLWLRARKAVGQ